MSATPRMSMIAAKAALDAITALVNAGGTGTLKVYQGSLPATTLTAAGGTLLATLTMNATAFGAATSAEANGKAKATANAIVSDTNAAASGTAQFFRILSGGSTCIFQGTIDTASADFILNSTTITAGDTVACTACIVRLPNGTASE